MRYVATLLVVLGLPLFMLAQQRTADELIRHADELERDSKYDSAIFYCKKALEISPSNARADLILGRCYEGKNDLNQAIKKFDRAINAKPDFDSAYCGRGNALRLRKLLALALQDHNKAIELNPGYAHAYLGRGQDYMDLAEYDAALKDLEKAVELSPDYFAYRSRGLAHVKKREYALGIVDYNRALQLNPVDTVTYNNRGVAYADEGDYRRAIQDYTQGLLINPNNMRTRKNRGYAYVEVGNYDSAVSDYNRYLESEPNDSIAHNSRGLAFAYSGQYNRAIADFEACLRLSPHFSYALLNILPCFIRLNRFDDAASYYKIYKDNNLVGYIENTAWAYYKSYLVAAIEDVRFNFFSKALDELKSSEKEYKSLLAAAGTDTTATGAKSRYTDVLALKGYILEKLNLYTDAEATYSQGLVIDPNQPDVKAGLARLQTIKTQARNTHPVPPSIELIDPIPLSSLTAITNSNTIPIIGRASSTSGIASVSINGNKVRRLDGDGLFRDVLKPKQGINKIKVTVFDDAGNSTDSNFVFTFSAATSRNDEDSLDIPAFRDSKPTFHAILIAEQSYTDPAFPTLKKPINDAMRLKRLLETKYSFPSSAIDTLFNRNREDILGDIIQKCNTLAGNDNLLIFYSGHGTARKDIYGEVNGFLVPCSAKKGNEGSYISYSDISLAINNTKVKHILFIVDACFGGSAIRGELEDAPRDVQNAYQRLSRKVMSSGNEEPVPDNSIFIYYFLKRLEENEHRYLIADDLFSSLKKPVRDNAGNDPQYGAILRSGDDTGDFVFIKN